MEKELKLKILKDGDIVKFKPKDDVEGGSGLGHAEFDFCVKWHRGKIKEIYIYHRQQRDIKNYYKIECGWQSNFSIKSWTHKGIEKPDLWREYYCKEHRAITHSVYVPINSNQFTIMLGSSVDITFDRCKIKHSHNNN